MPYPKFDRTKVKMLPLAQRKNKQQIERDHVAADHEPRPLNTQARTLLTETVERIRHARQRGRPVMMSFGAHTIKNGLGPVLIRLLEEGWLTHLATNGAGIIHDWEFSYQGQSSEDVAFYVERGQFGNWQDTGFNLNLALNVGAYLGLGYGEAVGSFIQNEGVEIPEAAALREEIRANADKNPQQSAAAADLLAVVQEFSLKPGRLAVPHPWKRFGVQAAAFRLGIPSTGHPMIGHDIIYNHPMNRGACVGRAAERDFLTFAESVSRISEGVYLSVGSAVMSPMVFEKSLSIAQNVALQHGQKIANHFMLVVDLAPSHWDWSRGEPPVDNPDYYLRYNKTFSRMGGTMRYLSLDNRDFLLHLFRALQ